jgi:hypothetical protein
MIKYFRAAQKPLFLFRAAHRNKQKYFDAFSLLWDDTKSTNCPGRAGFAKARYMKSFSKKNQLHKHLQSNQEQLRNRLSNKMRSRRFKLEPEQCSPKISIKLYNNSSKKVEFRCKMIQIPANINDTTTRHKLQGMSKDVIVVSSWPTRGLATMFKNWEYVVLSRVRTLSGLYLVEPIDMDKSFKPSSELKKNIENAR